MKKLIGKVIKMAKTRTNSKTTEVTTQKMSPTGITRGEAYELVDEVVRNAVRQQAREMEKYFRDIHERLVRLENK